MIGMHRIGHNLRHLKDKVRIAKLQYSGYSYNRESPSRQNYIIYGILGLNTAVFFAWKHYQLKGAYHSDGSRFLQRHFTLTKQGLKNNYYHTLLTYSFSHMDNFHFLINMIVFHNCSTPLIGILGTSRFLFLYLGGSAIAGYCQLYWKNWIPDSWFPKTARSNRDVVIGSSGATSSLFCYSVLSQPRAIWMFFGVIPVPAALLGALFVGKDIYDLTRGDSSVGNMAHLSGAAYGAYFYYLVTRGKF